MASWQDDAGPELYSLAKKESELDRNTGREYEVSARLN